MYVTINFHIIVKKRPEEQDDQVRHLVGGGVVHVLAVKGHPVRNTL